MIKQLQARKTSPKDFIYFWIRRWFRTLPNYYLVLVINIILVFLFNRENEFSILKFSFFLQNFNSAQANFFLESWSLTIEEFSYIFIPLILLLIGLVKRKVTQNVFLIVTICMIGISLLYRLYFHFYLAESIINSSTWSSALRKVAVYRLDSIYLGFIGAYVFINQKQFWNTHKISSFVIGAVFFIGLHLYIFLNQFQPNLSSLFFNVIYLTGVSMSVLLIFPLVYDIKFKGFFNVFITKISKWSYACLLYTSPSPRDS